MEMRTKVFESDTERVELIPLHRVRKLLNISWHRMMEIVRAGELRVFNISKQTINFDDIGADGSGLRVRSDDLEDYIDSIMIGVNNDRDKYNTR